MNKKYRNIILFFFIFINTYGQDIHFTQFNSSPLNLNPATTGFFDGTHRFCINNRTQWRSVTVPYSTISASVDTKILQRKLEQDMFGIGLLINKDKAGDLEFGTTQINFSISYIKLLGKYKKKFISFAVQPGIAQRTIDYDKLAFDNQFNGFFYDPELPYNEQLGINNFMFFDLTAGVYWNYQYKEDVNLNGGISFFHLNSPKQSLLDNHNITLNQRITIYGNIYINTNDKINILPGILIMKQGTYKEIAFGSVFKFIKNKESYNYTALNLGIFFRTKDAANLILGLDYLKFNFGVSYDINYSKLKTASKSKGGLELSVIYRVNKVKQAKIRAVPCPIF